MNPNPAILSIAILMISSTLQFTANAALNTAEIEEAAGAKGTYNEEEDVFKITYPRTDVPVRVDGTALPPFMGLTSWAAFKPGVKEEAMVMGDMVVFQDEVNPVMSIALDNGLEVTALHNHFFYDDPKVYFMHIGGEGDSEALARAVKKIQDQIIKIRQNAPEPARSFNQEPLPETSSLDAALLESVLGPGDYKDGMFKAVFGRSTTMPCGCEAGKAMGVNTWAAFYGSPDNALVDGDFAVYAGELQGVLKSLRDSGINIVAIHNHMENEVPRVLFLHYWGRGNAVALAEAVKKALNGLENVSVEDVVR